MNRRQFARRTIGCLLGAGVAGLGYARYEASWVAVDRQTVAVPYLPDAFANRTVALLADIHHSKYVSRDYVEGVVDRVNALQPDLIVLPGDFVHTHREHIFTRPCIEALARLRAPLGVFATPGNHDHWDNVEELHRCLRDTQIVNLTNRGVWVAHDGDRIHLAGVDDLWMGEQYLDRALQGVGLSDCTLLLCHNPDYVETLRDTRVKLVFSGHMHGGQVVLPGSDMRHVPSRYGTKYLAGLVRTPWTQVFVTRGLGTSGVPFRFRCRPEINLLTLVPA